MAEILVLAAHPQLAQSRITHTLMRAAARLDPARVEVRDLYALYPDYFIDTATEQAALARARLLVWLHPVQWYALPALLKLWLDEVFAFGWAYGPGGRTLVGKDLWQVCSTGGPQDSYRPDGSNRYFFDAFAHPLEQTAALVGMRWLPPLVLHGAHRVGEASLAAHAQTFVQRLQGWPDPQAWPEIAGLAPAQACDIPADTRPRPGPRAEPPPRSPAHDPPDGPSRSRQQPT